MVRILTECIPYHDGTKCDGCGASPIHGSRYKCHSCMNFNLCQSCYVDKNFGEKNKRHNKDHVMRMMMSQLDRKATPHHDRHCNGCRSENYPGIRYACKTCNKFNLCENCYSVNRFIPSTNYMSNHMTSHEVTKHELPTSEHHSNDIWKAMSIKMQNYFGSQFGTRDWDEYNADNEEELRNLGKRIGFAIYGPPIIVPDKGKDIVFGYDPKTEKHIRELQQRVLDLSKKAWNNNKVRINFTFISFWSSESEKMLPIIRVFRAHSNLSYFVEPSGRTYSSWEEFLDKNKLPGYEICYPIDGWYRRDGNGYCDLWFRESTECDVSIKVVKETDTVSTIVGIGGIILGIIGLFTSLAPIAAAALVGTTLSSSGYGIIQRGYKLIDHAIHKELINPLSNSESFFSWFSIIEPVFSTENMGVVSRASNPPTTESDTDQSTKAPISTVIFENLGLNTVKVMAKFLNTAKQLDEAEVSVLELFQLCASTLFFTNSVVNFQHASKVVKDAQRARLKEMQKQLPEEIQEIDSDQQISRGGTGETHGDGVSIRKYDGLMESHNWHTGFTGNSVHEIQASNMHTAQPAYFINKSGGRVAVMAEQAAIATAQHAHKTRFGGNRAHLPSTTTVIAFPSHELDTKSEKEHQARLPGTHYGYVIRLGPGGTFINSQPIEVTSASFGMREGELVYRKLINKINFQTKQVTLLEQGKYKILINCHLMLRLQ